MLDLRIKVDAAAAARQMKDIAQNQIPFTTALALTRTAQKAQAAVCRSLPQIFIIRRGGWALKGVRIEAANKRTLTAAVMDIHPYMALQEFGGMKFPMGKNIAVPLKGARPSRRSPIREANKPRNLLDSGKGFILRPPNRRREFICTWGGHRKGLVFMYVLIPKAEIHKAYRFAQTVETTVDKDFESTFAAAWEEVKARG
jgi:hypothetical protein